MTVDFLPPQQMTGMRARPIGEHTVVAMYMNNRAAESFARGQVNDAYWWARAAVEQDPSFVSSYNTLGVIYRRHGNLAEAQRVLAYALERDPKNTRVMSNLVGVLDRSGQGCRSARICRAGWSRWTPIRSSATSTAAGRPCATEISRPPGISSPRRSTARPTTTNSTTGSANAYFALGEIDRAQRELALALEYSTTRRDHDVYAAKLDRMRSSNS